MIVHRLHTTPHTAREAGQADTCGTRAPHACRPASRGIGSQASQRPTICMHIVTSLKNTPHNPNRGKCSTPAPRALDCGGPCGCVRGPPLLCGGRAGLGRHDGAGGAAGLPQRYNSNSHSACTVTGQSSRAQPQPGETHITLTVSCLLSPGCCLLSAASLSAVCCLLSWQSLLQSSHCRVCVLDCGHCAPCFPGPALGSLGVCGRLGRAGLRHR